MKSSTLLDRDLIKAQIRPAPVRGSGLGARDWSRLTQFFYFVSTFAADRLAFHACLEADQRMILGENDETDPV